MMQKRRCSYGRYDPVRTGGHLYCIFYDHCFLCRNGNLFCLYLAFLCGFMRISCIWKMVLQEKYGRIPRWVPVSIVTTCIAGVVIMAVFCILVFMGAAANEERDLDYVIVLGARVKRTYSKQLL